MSLFGKILAVLNVLVAIVFLVLAGMDYSKRQAWSYSHFRHQVAIHGLPLTDSDETWRLPGRTISRDLSKSALKEMFADSGGNDVRTQIEAVNDIQKDIKGGADAAADEPAKKQYLASYLISQARTGEDRERYQQMAFDRSKSADDLLKTLNDLFEQAVSDRMPEAQGGQARDLEARRRAIADVLYNVSSDANWHKRVQTVVGLQHYIGAADRQAANLQQMATRLNAAIVDEQNAFVRQYRTLLPEVQRLSDQVKDLDGKLKEQQDLVQKHTVLRNARQTEVADLQKQIQEAVATVTTETSTLDRLQKQLFALQQQVSKGQKDNQDLERRLRTQETGR
ncbi:MAG TPA: hypothetical protein VL371_22675 [Gemmataceae bacterium]|jgi:hypothetical protein|nr:hypothetical protein [Gemmataceae bacterium]